MRRPGENLRGLHPQGDRAKPRAPSAGDGSAAPQRGSVPDRELPLTKRSADVDDHVLDLGIEIESVRAELPAPPALLEPAPRRRRVEHVVAVHIDGPRLQRM